MVVCPACQHGKSHLLPFPLSDSKSSFPFELIVFLMSRDPPPLFLLLVHGIMLVLSITLANSLGFIPFLANMMSLQFFQNFWLLLNVSLIAKSNPFRRIGVTNLKNATFLRLMEYIIGLRALTPINKTGLWSVNTAILSKWALLSWPIPWYPSNTGLRLFKQHVT